MLLNRISECPARLPTSRVTDQWQPPKPARNARRLRTKQLREGPHFLLACQKLNDHGSMLRSGAGGKAFSETTEWPRS